jgi:1,4-dihydroxy-2-naphthoate octaprenyltransferase
MNVKMWGKALRIIPAVTKDEWDALDFLSKWLIATRAAALLMTFLSAALAGLFAVRDGGFSFLPWLAVAAGLILAHATNNIVNDYTDFVRGVDTDNYFRRQYGPQPVAEGLLTKGQTLRWAITTGVIALAIGLGLSWWRGWDPVVLYLLFGGVFLVLAYTWPLKQLALGEVSVILAWGPLMIGGGYYTLTGHWDWNVVLAGLPYALGVTTVIFGKHIDKLEIDKAKKIHTLPVLMGEKASRWAVIAMMVLPYLLVGGLIATRYFTPVMLLVVLALPSTWKTLKLFLVHRPTERPQWMPEGNGGWPLFFAPVSFINNRAFGGWFLLSLVVDVALRVIPSTSGFWR